MGQSGVTELSKPKPPTMTREEQLKQAIEEAIKHHKNQPYYHDVIHGIKLAMVSPSILRHADPEIMKQAGWVREERKWVLVKEEKPTIEGTYLLRFPQYDYPLDRYTIALWINKGNGGRFWYAQNTGYVVRGSGDCEWLKEINNP